MGQLLLMLVVALTVGAVVFGVTVLVTGSDPGLVPAEPDGRSVPLPGNRSLRETDLGQVRFDTAPRGYRMAQVDQALRRAAYDIGYKSELIGVLEAEVTALREGRTAEAEELFQARVAALGAQAGQPPAGGTGEEKATAEEPASHAGVDVAGLQPAEWAPEDRVEWAPEERADADPDADDPDRAGSVATSDPVVRSEST